MTDSEILSIAHRTCREYKHNEECKYRFDAATLVQFINRVKDNEKNEYCNTCGRIGEITPVPKTGTACEECSGEVVVMGKGSTHWYDPVYDFRKELKDD